MAKLSNEVTFNESYTLSNFLNVAAFGNYPILLCILKWLLWKPLLYTLMLFFVIFVNYSS